MAANKQTRNKPGPGRPKGSPNKTTKSAREAMELAFQGVGGVPALITWAKKEENRNDFYKLYARLIPVQNEHTGRDGGAIEVQQQTVDWGALKLVVA